MRTYALIVDEDGAKCHACRARPGAPISSNCSRGCSTRRERAREELAVLLADLAAGLPILQGANCKGSAKLFDPRDRLGEDAEDAEDAQDAQYRHVAALRLCASCPARQ